MIIYHFIWFKCSIEHVRKFKNAYYIIISLVFNFNFINVATLEKSVYILVIITFLTNIIKMQTLEDHFISNKFPYPQYFDG